MDELRDTVVVVGSADEKLLRLLAKLGYRLERPDDKTPLQKLLERVVVDVILVHVPSAPEHRELLEHLRFNEPTRKIPVVLVGASATEARVIAKLGFERVDALEDGASVGTVSAKIATLLRLRKIAGAEATNTNVAETNAMLRDLTSRFRKEIEEARKIQQGLLPSQLPRSERYELAATYRPLEAVGGDWYFARASDGKLALQIADVTGHGLSAAFICSMTKLALTAVGTGKEAAEAPHVLLERMNRLMAPQLPDERFVTFASALYDENSGQLQFARAGHPPAILFDRSTGTAKELKGNGFALGIMPEGSYELLSDKLEVGDVFVLYTDGITEAQNRSLELYGHSRIVETLKAAHADATAQQLQDAILSDFAKFTADRVLKDDVTLVVLRRVS